MENYIKLLFAKLTILTALVSLGWAVYYFGQEYSLNKSIQLGILVALGVLVAASILFFILSLMVIPVASRFESSKAPSSPLEEEPYIQPREERIVRHNTKEEYIEHINNKSREIDDAQQRLKEMAQEQGTSIEVMILLPFELTFLLAKESIGKLSFGKIKEESEEAGAILGTSGLGSSPQEIKLSIHSITNHSTAVIIISKSAKQEQSEKKNMTYIKTISNFLREKEKFYVE